MLCMGSSLIDNLMFNTFNLILKKVRNCILCIIRVWSLYCSVRVYTSLHFLPIRFVKLEFCLSVFQFFMFLFLRFLVFSFSVLRFELNVIMT